MSAFLHYEEVFKQLEARYPLAQIVEGRKGLVVLNFDELPFEVTYGLDERSFTAKLDIELWRASFQNFTERLESEPGQSTL